MEASKYVRVDAHMNSESGAECTVPICAWSKGVPGLRWEVDISLHP